MPKVIVTDDFLVAMMYAAHDAEMAMGNAVIRSDVMRAARYQGKRDAFNEAMRIFERYASVVKE